MKSFRNALVLLNLSVCMPMAFAQNGLMAEHTAYSPKSFRTDSVQRIREVVVTGTNLATSRNQLPYSISVVRKDEIEESGKSKILNILSGRVPGLFVTERGLGGFGVSTGGSGGIKIRGVGGSPTSQVLMMVDGQPQFAGNFSHHVADSYTADYAEKVEVIRGPASVLYGSNAMGGAINIITSSAQKQGVYNTLTAQYGSYNTARFDYVNKVKFGKFSSLVSFNYMNTDGISKDFDFKQGGGYAKVQYDFTQNWNAVADYNLLKFNGSDPSYVTAERPDPYTQHIIRGAASVNVNNQYANTTGTVKLFYSYGNHFIYDPKPFHSLDDHFGIIAYQSFSLFEGNDITAGIDYTDYSGKIPVSGGMEHTQGSMTTFNRKRINELGPYLVASQNLWGELITLNAGLRYVYNDKFGSSWVPQGGITLFPKGNTILKGSVAKGYRNPSFKELYLYKMANPGLKPETMMNYEVSLTQYAFEHKLRGEITGYIARGKDLIQSVAHPELGHPLNENTGKFKNKGIEVSLCYMPFHHLSFESTYSYMHTDLKKLTGAPKNQFFFGVNWQPVKQLRVDMQLRHIGGLYVHETVANQKYTLWNSKISYFPYEKLELFVLLDNILDQKYQINYGYEMPGFMAFGGLKVKF
ncbi:MAG: TonB-dependent receptor plug domain-containing protein [Bacteroidales bacterium]